MDSYSWLVIILSLAFSAFFSGLEIAFVTANKLRIELKNKQGSLAARILSTYVKSPGKFISTILIGNNIALVLYGIYAGEILDSWFKNIIPLEYQYPFFLLVLQTLFSTALVLVVAEFLPKVLFRINPDLILFKLVWVFQIFYFLFLVPVNFTTWLAKAILRLITRQKFHEDPIVFSKVDLDNYISESANLDLEEDADVDTEMFKNALDFDKVKARDCMTPRTELVAVELKDSIENLYQKFIDTGLSKILVYNETIDNIIGYVHQKELFKDPKSIKSVLIPIIIASEATPARELLKKFNIGRKSIAVVVDEFGGTAGIVTLEDILEEIFGEIDDEHDTEEFNEQKISDNEYVFSTRLEIDYLNETYELNIPEGEYNTLAGYILANHESIPSEGEIIEIPGFEISILKAGSARIDEVKLKKI